ncbi:MAG: VOC family protein [Sulfitobacter sp.]
MQITPYVFFNGNARAAKSFYERVLGAKTLIQMDMAEAPPEFSVPAERKDWIMHCTLDIDGQHLMLSDDFMANSPDMAGCSVQLTYDTAAEGKAIFNALATDGEIGMPWAATFWSAGFGSVRDQFGVRWMVGCDEQPTQ